MSVCLCEHGLSRRVCVSDDESTRIRFQKVVFFWYKTRHLRARLETSNDRLSNRITQPTRRNNNNNARVCLSPECNHNNNNSCVRRRITRRPTPADIMDTRVPVQRRAAVNRDFGHYPCRCTHCTTHTRRIPFVFITPNRRPIPLVVDLVSLPVFPLIYGVNQS